MNLIRQTLEKALIEAGSMIKKAGSRPIAIEYKSPVSLLTETDQKTQARVIDIIKRNFPNHDILAEETIPKARPRPRRHSEGEARRIHGLTCLAGRRGSFAPSVLRMTETRSKWIIDPVDGTTNFAHRLPFCCVSIGYEEGGIVKLGGVFNPFLDEFFWAERGKGARLNGKRIHVSKVKKLEESLVATGFPYDRRKRAQYYLKFVEEFMLCTHGIRRIGSSAIDLCYVACGRLDGYWEFNLQAWDQSAGALIVEEAGGKLGNFTGGPMSIYEKQTLASNGRIHGQMLRVIKKLL